jgi:CheY-like chemotaxis protein/two-component sensor histidine kinase
MGQLAAESPLRRDIEEINAAAQRAAALTRQLLAFSRRQVLQPRGVQLNTIVANLARMLRRLIGEDIELVTDLDPALGWVMADPVQIEQVLMNLAVNARDAMPQGGRLTIATANAELDAEVATADAPGKAGAYVVLTVSDTGIGMDRETQARIFEPFFTTKELGRGTGLGLSTVFGIVEQSGGHIAVESAAGHGATFKIWLPRTEPPAAAPAPAKAGRVAAAGRLDTVLVVEDDDAVRALLTSILSATGCRLLVATSGEEALRLAGQHTLPIDLLLTDMIMAGMNGSELAQRLRELHPESKVLFMSGYAAERHGVLAPDTHFLQKPFTPEALARKMREAVDQPPRS